MSFGDNVKRIRKEKGMSQDELARACGFRTRSTICALETGRNTTPVFQVRKIADALGVPVSALLEETKEEARQSDVYRLIPYMLNCDDSTIEVIKKILDYKDPNQK